MEPKIALRKASDEYWRAYEQWKKLDIKLDASKRATREEVHERRLSSEQAQNPSTGSVL
jgi:hypothetical protein